MWILSQNKSVIKQPKEIWIEPKDIIDSIWTIRADGDTVLGNYTTEERAKEIIRLIYVGLKTGSNFYIMPDK